jgi:hypothetical protein
MDRVASAELAEGRALTAQTPAAYSPSLWLFCTPVAGRTSRLWLIVDRSKGPCPDSLH